MTQRVRVSLKERSYDIVIGHGILPRLDLWIKDLGLGSDAVVVTHPNLKRLYGGVLEKAFAKAGKSCVFLCVPQGEQSKSAAVAMDLVEKIAKYDVGRKVFIVAFGGGVVGDLAGFVAAIYKRGVPYIQIPTTLLAQIDSAIGGKTGIDLTCGKNLAGAIYQPKCVIADSALLKTLPLRQIRNGLSEAIKYGVIKDPELFALIEDNPRQLLEADPKVMDELIMRCAKIKAQVVALDERDAKGIRAILNFGHTIGHAIEAAAQFDQYQHGEAVALGMRAAAKISVAMKLFSPKDEQRLNALISSVGLPSSIQGVPLKSILSLMMHDKKFLGSKNRFILAKKIGQVTLMTDIPHDVIGQSLEIIRSGA